MSSNIPLILIGAGGHAKVLLSLAKVIGLNVIAVSDPQLVSQGVKKWRGLDVLLDDDNLQEYCPTNYGLINGIGQVVGDYNRERIFDKFKNKGYNFPALVHPYACIDKTIKLAEGVQIMAGAIIQADVEIGCNVIINTRVSIDHDCIIEDNVHIAPGAVLCGNVRVGKSAFIASSASVTPGINIGEGSVIAAGASVVRDVQKLQLVRPQKMLYKDIDL